jgi:hypothetical protein
VGWNNVQSLNLSLVDDKRLPPDDRYMDSLVFCERLILGKQYLRGVCLGINIDQEYFSSAAATEMLVVVLPVPPFWDAIDTIITSFDLPNSSSEVS